MRSNSQRLLVKMFWEKERDLSRYTGEDRSLSIRGMGLWRRIKEAYGKPCAVKPPITTPTKIKLNCYIDLFRAEQERREMMELVDLNTRVKMHNKLVVAMVQSDAQGRAAQINDEEMDVLLNMLNKAQKITNPLAIRPKSNAADKMEEDAKRMDEVFQGPLQIKVQG